MSGRFLTSREETIRRIKTVERFLEAGHPPPDQPRYSNLLKSALRISAEELGIDITQLRRHVGTPTVKGLATVYYPDLAVDWKKYRPAPKATQEAKPEAQHDPVTSERERRASRDLAAENKRLVEELIEAQDLRKSVLGLIDPPLVPKIEKIESGSVKGERSVVIHFSDWHVGEVVDIDEMGKINSYSIDIFRKRAARLLASASALLTDHWKGKPPQKIFLIFGGDMITGEIHDELAKTNDQLSAPAVRTCAEVLAGIVKSLSTIAPVDVFSLAGNHGRLTKKPESKGFTVNSFDTLISQIVEMMTSDNKRVRFFYPKSGDALFNVYDLVFCAVHGDRIGSRGGMGFIGPVATISRGVQKMRGYYTSQGVIVDHFLIGHFHTTAKVPRAFSNGSLVGPSEYSRDLRADPEPAKQNMIIAHSERGVIAFEEIYCGDIKEGTIYKSGTV